MSKKHVETNDLRNQKPTQDKGNVDNLANQSYNLKEYNNKMNPEDFSQEEIDAQIEEYNSLNSLEDIYPSVGIDFDDFLLELIYELEYRISQTKAGINQGNKGNNSTTIRKYENWISILNYINGFITPQELHVLDMCISTYASVCGPYERRKEITRNIGYMNSWFDIDLLELESKLYRIDLQALYDLTEILLEMENVFYFTANSDSDIYSSSGKHDWPITTFYYCWEIFEFDDIHWYEMQAEISLANAGLIHDIWNFDHVIFIVDEHNAITTEYDYYTNQFKGSEHQNSDKIDIGDLECLTEDDLFDDTWMVEGMKLPNFIDYFWEAELLFLCQTERGDFFTEYQYELSEDERFNYPKYLCFNGDFGFRYCNEDSCEGCTKSCTEKELNEIYVLWKKYVQPI